MLQATGERLQASGLKRLLVSCVALAALAGCRGQTSRETPLFGIRNMYDQPKYEVQEESAFFSDRRTMRPLVDGVVAHDQETTPEIAQGRLEDESGYVLQIPKEVVERTGGMQALVERGKDRYDIYCALCHDHTGTGEGLVKRRAVASGATAFVPPTFHQDRIRHMPDGQLFATITNGKNNMPPYAMQLHVDERWAIVGYVRALQVAQPKLGAQAALAPTAAPGGTSLPAPGGTSTSEPEAKADSGATHAETAAAETGAPAPSHVATDAAAAPQEKKP
jgi:mono/diheme cytochrome c family protein